MKRRVSALFAAICLAASAPAQVTFQFDYTYDTGFFTGANASRQAYLTAAAGYVSNLISATPLSAITPDINNDWDVGIFDPRNTGATISVGNLSIAANTIVVYAGGYDLTGSTLGVGGPAGYSASGFSSWFDTLNSRGNGSYKMSSVGAITFDTPTNWYFDSNINTTESFGVQSDFFSVAVHELFHLLGFGTNSTWNGLISGATFTGAASVAEYGGAVPLDPGLGHWLNGTNSVIFGTSTAQEAVMDPSITTGTRKYATDLDVAGLSDLGYVTAVPEPATCAALFGAGALLLALRRRRE